MSLKSANASIFANSQTNKQSKMLHNLLLWQRWKWKPLVQANRQEKREKDHKWSQKKQNSSLETRGAEIKDRCAAWHKRKKKRKEHGTNRMKDTGKEQCTCVVCMQECVFVCVSRAECGLHGWAIPVQSAGWLWVSVVGGPTEGFDHYRVWQKGSDREVTLSTCLTHTHTQNHHDHWC